jgi:hypothetical protein
MSLICLLLKKNQPEWQLGIKKKQPENCDLEKLYSSLFA